MWGVNFGFATWWWNNRGTEEQIQLINDWDVKQIRFTFNPEYLNAKVEAKLFDLVTWCNERGLTPQLAYNPPEHDTKLWAQENWLSWFDVWRRLTQLFVGYNVIFDIFNEPFFIDSFDAQFRYRQCIDAIREVDDTKQIVVEEISVDSWRDISLNFELTHPLERPNIIYEFHYYYRNELGFYFYKKEDLRSLFNLRGIKGVLDKGFSVRAGEFNCYLSDTPNNGLTFIQNMMELLDEDGYDGGSIWWWNIHPQTGVLTDWYGTSNESGQVFKSYIQGTVPPPPPPTPTYLVRMFSMMGLI